MQEAAFRKSSFCTDAHGCVEVGIQRDLTQIRDTEDKDGPRLAFGRPQWSAFVAGVKAGKFDA